MKDKKEAQYLFVILQPNDSNMYSVKSIMNEKKLMAHEGLITFYSSYNAILKTYTDKFPNQEMWGIGFSKKTLNNFAEWMGYEKIKELEDGNLIYTQVRTEGILFTKFDLKHNDVFFVAPTSKKCEEVWFAGKTDRGYKKWWCKGIHKGCCHSSNKDITAYLDTTKYQPYFGPNFTTICKKDLFSHRNLLLDDVVLMHEYTVMNLTSKELRDGVIKRIESNKLF